MKSIFLLCFTYGLALFIFSCKQKTDYSKEISTLDSLSAVLVISENALLTMDTTTLRASFRTISESLQNLTEKISKDTVKKKTALLLSTAYEQTKNIHTLLENKKHFEKAIRESTQHINDLKHDLAANLIAKNQSAKYIDDEAGAIQKICNAANQAVAKAATARHTLDSLKTEIIFLTDSLTK